MSGLAFIPMAFAPVYCATKAGIHSFSLSLRHQLSKTGVKVFEVIPPMVDTGLGGGKHGGMAPRDVAAAVMEGLRTGEYEIAVGMARNLVRASMADPKGAFQRING